jgi:ATP-dependent RNA helicase DeaD
VAGLAKALESRGFSELTLVQKAVLDPALKGRDLRISSQTGSGKTVAIGFVLAADLTDLDLGPWPRKTPARPRILLIAPTRELAAQIAKELSWLYAPLGVRLTVVTGGTNIGGDFRELARGPHVLVGTPGRLLDHVRRESIDLSQLRAAVLDEADEMLDMGFRDELEGILDETPAERHTHMVSATFPREVLALARSYQNSAAHVEGTQVGTANVDITHVGHVVKARDKVGALINILLSTPGERTLVFVRTRAGTAQLAVELGANGFTANALSGDMGQRERTATLEGFRNGAVRVLVATDVAARGLDINNIGQVVHFDLPDNAEAFTHRSGRTGRAGNKGTSYVLVPPSALRRAEYVFRRAAVHAQWRKVPSPDSILAAADQRLVDRFGERVAELEPTRRLRWLADKLLEDNDPATVIAALLERSEHAGPCAPRAIRSEVPSERRVRDRDHGDSRTRGDSRSHGPSSERRPRRQSGSYTPFHVTWGSEHGASPSRLLAMVCRRGDIRGNQVGAIRIGDRTSLVEVASDVADAFGRAAGRPDPRNAKIRIRPWEENAAPARGHRGRPTPRKAPRAANKFAKRKPRE